MNLWVGASIGLAVTSMITGLVLIRWHVPQPNDVQAKRVSAGALFLDSVAPGWHSRINMDQLDIKHVFRCTIAQLFDDYERGVQHLGLSREQCIAMGFRAYPEEKYAPLTAAWKKEIVKRRERSLALV